MNFISKMIFYFLFIVFLYAGVSNARVVPLHFKLDNPESADRNIPENEIINGPPRDEIEIISNSKKKNATAFEFTSKNASNLLINLSTNEENIEEPNAEIFDNSAIILEEEFKSVSEFISLNNSDSRDSFEAFQVKGTLSGGTDEDLKFETETSVTNNSASLEHQNNLESEAKNEVLNDTFNQVEFFSDKSDQNKTSTAFDANSDHNETSTATEINNIAIFDSINGTNTNDNLTESQHLLNSTKVEVFLGDITNFTEEFQAEIPASEKFNSNLSTNTAGGILSGFEFLINSEVARNAAKAMEVFNFSDPLTDHIIEENEFHSFLPAFNPVQELDSPNQTRISAEIVIDNSKPSNETLSDFSMSLPSGNDSPIEELNQADFEEMKKDSSKPLNITMSREEINGTKLTELEIKVENITSEVSSLNNSEEKIQLVSETSILNQDINISVSQSSTDGSPECPPPGWCIFWFLSQDTCAVNDHCLGSRICCKIGCSKTCIEV